MDQGAPKVTVLNGAAVMFECRLPVPRNLQGWWYIKIDNRPGLDQARIGETASGIVNQALSVRDVYSVHLTPDRMIAHPVPRIDPEVIKEPLRAILETALGISFN